MSHFLESKRVRTVLWILGGMILLLIAFGMGIAVGTNRARFAYGFDKDYYQNFLGVSPGGPMIPAGGMPQVNIHGTVGTVIDIATSTISVKDQASNEQSIAISSGTVIRENDNTILISDISIGDQIAVIGEPNDQGQIQARFVRVFTTSAPQ